ncbi:MAG TPA: carboxypeptidase regulatory-like domain-containing protein [Thermoanaerobaculia bacterium]|nr:carboxypeptidase regulatory-like domain-containing protein [Thermoanaerobaculia bacterium]
MRDYKMQGPIVPGPRRAIRNDVPPLKGGNAARKKVVDPAVQHTPGPNQPGELGQFEGLADIDNQNTIGTEYVPPDTNGDISPNNYIEYINTIWAVYDRSGNLQLGPLPGNSFWQGLGGVCETGDDGDPIVKYDRAADRWFASQFYVNGGAGPFHQCIAISVTNDPTGDWYQYDFFISDTAFSDYPKFGIWPDAYYMTSNLFGDTFDGGAFAFNRTKMLAGDPSAEMIQFSTGGEGGVLPSDMNGTIPPPDGSPNYFMTYEVNPARLLIWQFHVDWDVPANSSFTGPVDIPVPDFNTPVCGSFRDQCVPQLDSTELLETLSQDLMYPLAYRNFGDHEAIVASQTVGDGNGVAQVRWYEIRDPGGSPVAYQASTYAPDSTHRWMPSIAMDHNGNIALNYSRSDTTLHPQAAMTGRLATDPLNTMGDENIWYAGAGSQQDSFSRWGDYTSIFIDPLDDCTFWAINEYYAADAAFDFHTRIGSFKFPSCSIGPTGTLEGTVTDGANPIAGVKVSAGAASTTTDGSGHYSFTLPSGPYDMTAVKYGYLPGSASGIEVTDGGDTVQNFVLGVAPSVMVNGTVKDGSGGGWPLYAKIVIKATGAPTFTLYTDPVSGYYSQQLVSGVSYTFTVTAVSQGYQQGGGVVPLGPVHNLLDATVLNWTLNANPQVCNAPGYTPTTAGLFEDFEGGVVPKGWTVINNSTGGNGAPTEWIVVSGTDPCGDYAGNLTGGSGFFAVANSDCPGATVVMDTQLITPPVDMTSFPAATLRFNEDYDWLFDNADVDISTDGGATWTNVLAQTASARGPLQIQIDISALAVGHDSVQARFHYYNAAFAWWWQVDNVLLGEAGCVPGTGGLVVGNVLSANSGLGLNGATVENMTNPGLVKTFATPDDPNQPDGMYILYSDSGSNDLQASLSNYGSDEHTVVVVPGSAIRQNFILQSGNVAVNPPRYDARVNPPGGQQVMPMTLTNSGGASVNYEVIEINSPALSNHTQGHVSQAERQQLMSRLAGSRGKAEGLDGKSGTHLPPLPNAPRNPHRIFAAGDVLISQPTDLTYAWGVGYSGSSNSTWNTDLGQAGGDDHAHEFDATGVQTGQSIDLTPAISAWAGDGAYNANTGNIWYVDVVAAGSSCIFEVNPATLSVTGNTICPNTGQSERGLAYDLSDDTYFTGSWLDGVIYHFDASGSILDSSAVGLGISGLAYYPDSGHLFVQVSDPIDYSITVLDAKNNYAVVGNFYVSDGAFDDHGGAGMEADCEGNLWMVNQTSQMLFKVASGESGSCAVDIPWLTVDPTSGVLGAGNGASNTAQVNLTFDGGTLLPGLRQAQVKVKTDTPVAVPAVPVTLTVRFLDVPDNNQFQAYIYGAAGAGIMMGGPPNCSGGILDFCPNNVVTRADMAGYIFRAVHGPATPPPVYQNIFSDVTFNDYNAFYIQGIYNDGITAGCGNGQYCPNTPNTRAQMSVFIWKGQHGSEAPPACTPEGAVFGDVPCGSFAADYIYGLYNEGVTAGCGGGNFCPNANITNGQMAVFLVKGFNIPHL